MKIQRIAAIVLVSTMSVCSIAENSQFYAGVKTGRLFIDIENIDDNDASSNGFVLGYSISNGFSVEYEQLDSSGIDIEASGFGTIGKVELDHQALYGVWRSPEDLYFKAKLGYLKEDIEVKDTVGLGIELDGDDDGVAAGFGGGLKIGDHASVELEYTFLDDETEYLNLGVLARF